MAMAAVRAVDKVCTPAALEKAESLNIQALTRIREIIDEFELPAHTVGFGVKGCVTWSDKPAISLPKRPELQFNAAENRECGAGATNFASLSGTVKGVFVVATLMFAVANTRRLVDVIRSRNAIIAE